MKYTVKVTAQFKKDYKRVKKRGLPINLLNNGILVLTLTRTGSHGDFFSKNILLLSKDSATGVLLLPVTLSFF